MKRILLGVICIWGILGFGTIAEPERKWVVMNNSRLEISGSSNVNEFQCMNVSYVGQDTLYEEKHPVQDGNYLNGLITLKAEGFDCQHKLITNDFRKTLNTQEYPEITVRFLGLMMERDGSSIEQLNGQVEITIAGECRRYKINSVFRETGKNMARLTGQKVVKLSDFGLEPHTKMLGMIKVDDTVKVEFNLVIRSI